MAIVFTHTHAFIYKVHKRPTCWIYARTHASSTHTKLRKNVQADKQKHIKKGSSPILKGILCVV